jgi:hypothetical protein
MNFLTSWRTTLAGGLPAVIMLLQQLLYAVDSDPSSSVSWVMIAQALGLMGLGLVARDNVVTSERAHAK